MLTAEIMNKLWVHGNQHVPGLIEGIVAAAPAVFAKYGFDKPLVWAHFMAQCSWECDAGLEMVENLNYSAPGLVSTWPTRFNRWNASQYAHSPKMIADKVYGGRMGNAAPPSDDGWRFRGRGLTQLTGRENYTAITGKLGEDFVEDPELVNDPTHALEVAVCDFIQCGCVAPAEADDLIEVTKHLNGGTNGFAGRKAWLVKWKAALLN